MESNEKEAELGLLVDIVGSEQVSQQAKKSEFVFYGNSGESDTATNEVAAACGPLIGSFVANCVDSSQAESLQHDLEKLQEAHNKLMGELDEKNNFTEQIHLQLDKALNDSDHLKHRLSEVEGDLEATNKLVKEKDAKLAEVSELETKLDKMKMLAVKLKKELAEAKADARPVAAVAQEPKSETAKQLMKENERVSNLYQQVVKNYQNLQKEFDNLQDERDTFAATKKTADSDLMATVTELNKVREELSDCRDENNVLRKRINGLEREIEDSLNRRKELESKIILLENDLSNDRKKLVNQCGLEKTLIELRHQMDLKTTEIVELGDIVEKAKIVEVQKQAVTEELSTLRYELELSKETVQTLEDSNSSLKAELEDTSSTNEQDRVKVIDLANENKRLEGSLASAKEMSARRSRELEAKVKGLKDKLNSVEIDLDTKQKEFEAYKARVHRVLSEKSAENKESDLERARRQELEEKTEHFQRLLETSEKELESENLRRSQLESDLSESRAALSALSRRAESDMELTRKENDSLKSLSRDLQCKLVVVRSELEKNVQELEERLKEKELELYANIAAVKAELDAERSKSARNGHSTNLLHIQTDRHRLVESPQSSESTTLAEYPLALVNGHELPNGAQVSPHSVDGITDIDSLESASLPSRTKRLSISSCSGLGAASTLNQGNVLDEILNSTSTFDERQSNFCNVFEQSEDTGRLDRLTELLEESDSNNLLLTEQNRVLKEEIRRLERSMARVELAQNLEYLKNIVIKFLALEAGSSEKLQLVPVLKTILKLTKDEEDLLNSSADGADFGHKQSSSGDPGAAAGPGGGWQSFLWG